MKPPVMNLSNQKNQHIVWLDVVRFIAMFTVVCCHCTDPFNFYPGTAPNIGEIKLWENVRTSCMERVEISVVAVTLKKKRCNNQNLGVTERR